MKIVSVRKELGNTAIFDARQEELDYRSNAYKYSREEIDGHKVIYQHPDTGDVVILLDDKRMAVLYALDLDIEEK